MKTLEIQIKDEVRVFDSVGEAIAFIKKIIQKVFDSGEEISFQIDVKRESVRAPPIGINVSDKMEVKEALS